MFPNTRRRLVNKSKMDLVEIGWSGSDCTVLAQDTYRWRALVNLPVT
jgi:hypothetical protein